jgi:hypothetical protein
MAIGIRPDKSQHSHQYLYGGKWRVLRRTELVELQEQHPTTTRLIELANDMAYAPTPEIWNHKRD